MLKQIISNITNDFKNSKSKYYSLKSYKSAKIKYISFVKNIFIFIF